MCDETLLLSTFLQDVDVIVETGRAVPRSQIIFPAGASYELQRGVHDTDSFDSYYLETRCCSCAERWE